MTTELARDQRKGALTADDLWAEETLELRPPSWLEVIVLVPRLSVFGLVVAVVRDVVVASLQNCFRQRWKRSLEVVGAGDDCDHWRSCYCRSLPHHHHYHLVAAAELAEHATSLA